MSQTSPADEPQPVLGWSVGLQTHTDSSVSSWIADRLTDWHKASWCHAEEEMMVTRAKVKRWITQWPSALNNPSYIKHTVNMSIWNDKHVFIIITVLLCSIYDPALHLFLWTSMNKTEWYEKVWFVVTHLNEILFINLNESQRKTALLSFFHGDVIVISIPRYYYSLLIVWISFCFQYFSFVLVIL